MSSTRLSTRTDRSRERGGCDGFTLLELLVALSIFSLVIGMSMFSLRHSFGVLRHLDAPFAEETRRVAALRDCVASALPYVAQRSDMFNRNREFYTCFNGDSDRMTFVSGKAPTLPGPVLCRVGLKDKALVLEEASLYAKDSNYLDPSFATRERRETVLFPDVKSFRLEYFQGDKQLSTLKEELPTMVKITVAGDDRQREFFCRLQTDFSNKKELVKAIHEPL